MIRTDRLAAGATRAAALVLLGAGAVAQDAPPFTGCCLDFSTGPAGSGNDALTGQVVAVSGASLFASNPLDSLASNDAGAVYRIEHAGPDWEVVEVLRPADPQPGEGFGSALAVDGERVAVASNRDNGDLDFGCVYIFERGPGGYVEVQRLLPTWGFDWQGFGRALALDGDRLLVADTAELLVVGRVLLYERQPSGDWTLQQVLDSPNGAPGDYYGASIALEGDRALVGAPLKKALGQRIGGAYLWRREPSGTWSIEQLFTVPALTGSPDGEHYGTQVDFGPDRLVVGAPSSEPRGRVHTYRDAPGGWLLDQTLEPGPGSPDFAFGRRFATHAGRLLVGAGQTAGAVGGAELLRFAGGAYQHDSLLLAPDPQNGDGYGAAVALEGSTAAIGAPGNKILSGTKGCVYLWALDLPGFPTLYADSHEVSLSQGGTVELFVDSCWDHRDHAFLVLGTASGTAPGFDVDGVHVPLVQDPWFDFTLASPNVPPLSGGAGTLRFWAEGQASITVPPNTDPSLAGLLLHHSAVLIDVQGTGAVVHASDPVPLTLLP